MRAVALDSNLLILLVVGEASPDFIGKSRALKAYSVEDYLIVRDFCQDADRIISTPHCWTEVSNLVDRGVLEPVR